MHLLTHFGRMKRVIYYIFTPDIIGLETAKKNNNKGKSVTLYIHNIFSA